MIVRPFVTSHRTIPLLDPPADSWMISLSNPSDFSQPTDEQIPIKAIIRYGGQSAYMPHIWQHQGC